MPNRLRTWASPSIWLPPAYKGHGGVKDVGYGVYDLYDLGEFDQKGSVPTKYGTKDEYLAAIDALHEAGIAVCADIVLNHRMGADASETVRATPINPHNRHEAIGEPEMIEAWTRFTFPGRAGAYSDFTWDWTCFHGIDWDAATGREGLWLFEGKHWNESVNTEFGNFDYLMGCDVHVTDPRVSEELDRWGRWYVETTGVDALRLDAVKHVGSDFYARWLEDLRASTGRPAARRRRVLERRRARAGELPARGPQRRCFSTCPCTTTSTRPRSLTATSTCRACGRAR